MVKKILVIVTILLFGVLGFISFDTVKTLKEEGVEITPFVDKLSLPVKKTAVENKAREQVKDYLGDARVALTA